MYYPGGLLRQLKGNDRLKELQPLPCRRLRGGYGRSSAMEKDFRSAPRCFRKTSHHLRRGKRGTIQAVYSKDELCGPQLRR